jgi:flagellin-like protein
MKLKQLLNDDDAVSPVIGVILMVAITVILAAVIATFVLGLGEQVSQTSPNASFTFDYNNDTGQDTLDITHAGGPNINADQLTITGNGSSDLKWSDFGGSPNEVSAGTSITVNVSAGNTISVTWENEEGTESSTLQRYDVPEN